MFESTLVADRPAPSLRPATIDTTGLHLDWGAPNPQMRGPVVACPAHPQHRNVIGAHGGPYSVYRGLATATGALSRGHRPELTNTQPVVNIPARRRWSDIVSLDPYGHMVGEVFADQIRRGVDVRPTIAVTAAHITVPEIQQDVAAGILTADNSVLTAKGEVRVVKAAIDPVWHLPGLAERLGVNEARLRRALHDQTGGMYPDLIQRPELEVFLPPIGNTTVYIIGDANLIGKPGVPIACRVHDECNGSDVFGSDICTCRPYLIHGIEECVTMAQNGGVGIVVYNRKEGRALGEVTKFLVYNARKRQPGGDRADTYFRCTECVAGVPDMRFQELMPDVFHWLGITQIDVWVSMSNMKHGALTDQGIKVIRQVEIPPHLIPADASVEIEAKKAAGYFSPAGQPTAEDLRLVKGRGLGQ